MDQLIKIKKEELVCEKDPLKIFAEFMRIDVANGAASPRTIKTYQSQVGQFFTWCQDVAIDPIAVSNYHITGHNGFCVSHFSTS